nr:glycosyltransferase family 2 protein [Candidatus Sigynarchaeota archaeon]
MKLSIIMPVYNERRYIEQILKKIWSVKTGIDRELIIVESNSTDGTREIVKQYERKDGIHVIYQDKPLGKGAALKEGFKRARGDIILIQDADLEYEPDDYPILLKPILDNDADFVLGSRHLGKNTWKIRRSTPLMWNARLIDIGSEFLSWLFFLLYHVKLTDPQTMFKVFRRECISGMEFKSNSFAFDWEIVIKMVKKGFVPVEIPVRYRSRSKKEGKKVKILKTGLQSLWCLIKYKFFN